MADATRTLWLSDDDNFEGPLTVTEVKKRIVTGVAEGKDTAAWDLYEKVDFSTTVEVFIPGILGKGGKK